MIVIQLIDTVFLIYTIMLIVRVFSSWFPEYRSHVAIRFISFYTDPYLNFFRRFIPPLGMLDLSPLVAFFALQIMEGILKHLAILILR